MDPVGEIVNRVAGSSLKTFDLELYYEPGERILLDIKDQLFQGLILKEKDFREFLKGHEWSQYQSKFVAITCSEDVIVPTWAYMLLTTALSPFARTIVLGGLPDLEMKIFTEALSRIEWKQYKDAKVVIKGCSKVAVPVGAYVEVTRLLRPYAASIMYGEPCSTVPVFKRSKA